MKKLFLLSLFALFIVTTGCDSSSSSGSGDTSSGSGDGTYVSDAALDNSVTIPDDVSVTGLDGDLDMGSFDATDLMDLVDCMNSCNDDMTCMMQCYSDAGLTIASGAFSVGITLRNLGSTSETVTIKAGTVLTPDSSAYQPMMLIQDIDLTTSGGETETFLLPVYCLDPDLNAPDSTNSYTISNITDDDCLLAILAILATKDVDSFDYSHSGVVQENIWNCITDDPVDTAALEALPDL